MNKFLTDLLYATNKMIEDQYGRLTISAVKNNLNHSLKFWVTSFYGNGSRLISLKDRLFGPSINENSYKYILVGIQHEI